MTIKYLLTILISTITLTLSAQIDTLYVWAESGLLLRDKPNVEGKVVGKLDYGDTVVINRTPRNSRYTYEVFQKTTFDNGYNSADFKLKGNFVEVKVGDSSAYVFNGYLSKLLPVIITAQPDGVIKRESWDEYFDRTQSTIKKINTEQYGNKITKIVYGDGSILHQESGDSYGNESVVLTDLTDNEIYLLIQAINGIESKAKKYPQFNFPYENSKYDMSFLLGEVCSLNVKRQGALIIIIKACSC